MTQHAPRDIVGKSGNRWSGGSSFLRAPIASLNEFSNAKDELILVRRDPCVDTVLAARLLDRSFAAFAPPRSQSVFRRGINPAAVALAERHGMKPVFETARMYTQTCPNLPYADLFGVTTLELAS